MVHESHILFLILPIISSKKGSLEGGMINTQYNSIKLNKLNLLYHYLRHKYRNLTLFYFIIR